MGQLDLSWLGMQTFVYALNRPILLKNSVSRCDHFFVCRTSRAIVAGSFSRTQTERTHARRLPLRGRPSALRDRVAPYRRRFFTPAPKPSFSTE